MTLSTIVEKTQAWWVLRVKLRVRITAVPDRNANNLYMELLIHFLIIVENVCSINGSEFGTIFSWA